MPTRTTPTATLAKDFSDVGAQPTPWPDAVEALKRAEVFWVTTVRPNGHPHQTPLIAVWQDDALYFCTGPEERKAKNIAKNPHVLLTTGDNAYTHGLDLVIEGEARRITDDAHLRRLADAWLAKYGPDWKWEVRDGAFHQGSQTERIVFEVAPRRALGFKKGTPFGQTTWRFDDHDRR
jgi:PPOX class probable F420-dependent enzyme